MKPGLCLESGEFVPAEQLNAMPIDVAVPDQPSPFDVPTMSHVARRKLGALVADGHEVCGVMIQRVTADGVQRGAVSAGGMVIWWRAERVQGVPDEQRVRNLLARYENQWHRMGELWERCQGKGWPKAESEEFARLRDELTPATRALLLAYAQPAPQASVVQQEPTDEQILATVGRKGFGFSESRPLGQQWDQVCELIRAVVRERYTQQAKPQPMTHDQVKDPCAEAGYDKTPVQARADFINGIRHAEAAHGIKGTQP